MKESSAVVLGQSGVRVSPVGVGTNAWGRGGKARPELEPVFTAALQEGVGFLDTAEIYGPGGSERTIGLFLRTLEAGAPRPVILSKFFPLPWRRSKQSFAKALKSSLGRLGLPSIDVYLVHFPMGPQGVWADALADAVEAGLVRAVGVSNYGAAQVRDAAAILQRRGIRLACNEVEYSLLRRDPERNGTVAACNDLGATIIAYRPLGLGLLARADGESQPRGWQNLMTRGMRPSRSGRLMRILREICDAHGGKTVPQVALNWVCRKGALPIPGATSVNHVRENAGSLGWSLTDAEVASLDEATSNPAR